MKAWRFQRKFVLFAALCFALAPAQAVQWPQWDNDTPHPHTVFGEPTYVGHDPNHHFVRAYGAFTVY